MSDEYPVKQCERKEVHPDHGYMAKRGIWTKCPGMHRGLPTRDSTDVHPGSYANRCPICTEHVQAKIKELRPEGYVVRINVGDRVRIKPEHVPSGWPEWGTVTTVRYNPHTDEVWYHTWEHSNQIFRYDNFCGVQQT